MHSESYKDFLKAILIERQKINPSYSMRAFAGSIGLSNSQLSRVLCGKQGLSFKKAQHIASKIGLNQKETNIFCLMVQASDARSKVDRDQANEALKSMQTVEQDTSARDLKVQDYDILKEWYNIAILELVSSHNFSKKPEWISKQVGITPLLAKESLNKLLRLGVIASKSGKLQRTQKILKISDSTPSDLMKNYYNQLLDKAKESIYLQNIEERHLSSVTISLDDQDIQTLNQEIETFRSHFNRLAESLANKKGKKRTSVYCLTTQFFKINKGADL